jgi:predicted acylesterase/phospholipase RssA
MPDTKDVDQARSFIQGERLTFAQANALWNRLKKDDELSWARQVLQRLREEPDCVSDGLPNAKAPNDILCHQQALLTSKDPELDAATRHDDALELLARRFEFIKNKELPGDGETLGIAGGISKRRWSDLGQLKDLMQAAEFYERGARNDLGDDAYPHINAAFLEDVLAEAGQQPEERRRRARELRERILRDIEISGTWFNTATRAEALFGLERYDEATEVLRQSAAKPAPWELRTMAEQVAHLAHIHKKQPLSVPSIRKFFDTLLSGAGSAIRSVMIGKVGLALSGGGFRASFYHLGVLACLAECDALRDVEVLSCVSGGSIVGACYWLKLRQRLLQPGALTRDDYIELVRDLIKHFQLAVDTDVRGQVQPYVASILWHMALGEKGALSPEKVAAALEEHFYRPLWSAGGLPRDNEPIRMDQLVFTPADHNPALAGPGEFNPAKHNWLRAQKVPALILNATTVNTGHVWHFTSTWMGESPWAVHEAADSIPRLEWSNYDGAVGWHIGLGRAVAASACVPMVFAPLRLGKSYEKGIEVSLVDGGVHDNQGTVSLLASGCNVILVSDACGQLVLEPVPTPGLRGLKKSTMRSMDTLMERVRLANFADLDARRRSGLLRGLMFLHLKSGLDAEVIRLSFSQEAYVLKREPLSRSGVRKDFQQALAELRTDLNVFTADEACGLMACGYQMASKALYDQLPKLQEIWQRTPRTDWPFKDMLDEITSGKNTTALREKRLQALREGSGVDFWAGSPSRLIKAFRRVRSSIRTYFAATIA